MSAPNLPAAATPIKCYCPSCGPDRNADVVAHYHSRYDDEASGVWGETDYRILKCRGCDQVYFQTNTIFSEDWDYETDPNTGNAEPFIPHKISYWPEPPSPSGRVKPVWSGELSFVDATLESLFDDLYVALRNDLRVLAAIGIRTVFDRASELLGVDPAKSFREKLSDLMKNGKIGSSEQDALDILTDAGSAAAHRGWRPTAIEIDTMMSIIESFIYRTFLLDPAAKTLRQNIPKKQKRTK